jgi:hypothetical protein
MLALRDNPIALAEGRPGAPRISPWACAGIVSAGDTARYAPGLTFNTGSTNFGLVVTTSVANSGGVRIKATHSRTSGTGQ